MQRLSLVVASTGLAFALGACQIALDDFGDDYDVQPIRSEFILRIENVAPWTALKSGIQTESPTGDTGAIGPGEHFEVTFTAGKQQSVSFATMLMESNDWFLAPGPEGIPLYDAGGRPLSGDVTRYVQLWDAGTELDQEPGVGNATGQRQPQPNFGVRDPNLIIREIGKITTLTDGSNFTRPDISRMIRAVLVWGDDQRVTLRLTNVSTTQTLVTSIGQLSVHLSPLVWTVHTRAAPLFEIGGADRKLGLENLAEDGLPERLGTSLRVFTGYPTPLSPGVAAVHTLLSPLFTVGQPDQGKGLERLAEDGDNREFAFALETMIGVTDSLIDVVGFIGPVNGTVGVAMPGSAYEVVVTGEPGDAVSFVTMFGMSNDWFFATQPAGIPLFKGVIPVTGDVTSEMRLYDLGTELDQELGVGNATGLQQRAAGFGDPDAVRTIREVTAARYPYALNKHIRVTLTPRPIVQD